jgi:hypothetical protein
MSSIMSHSASSVKTYCNVLVEILLMRESQVVAVSNLGMMEMIQTVFEILCICSKFMHLIA